MNILYILGAYKPRASANGICSENIIEQLMHDGHTVTVLANASIGCKENTVNDDLIEIYRIKQRVYLRMKEWTEANRLTHPRMSRAVAKIAFAINKFKLLMSVFIWPKISKSTTNRFKKAALRLHSKYNYDVIISVYTPIEALLAGFEVKKQYPNVMFVPYFLDSLSGGYGPKYFNKQTIINRGLAIERDIFGLADKIVLMKSSKAHHNLYNEKFIKKLCFLDIPMLKKIQPKLIKEKCFPQEIRMVFVGSITASVRNPDTLISALALLKNENIICEFIGNIDCIERFEKLKKLFGERLIFTGFMNHELLVHKIQSADILLNVGNLIETMVPSKIFEYMSYGKPIISTFEIKNEPSRKYLEQYPLALLLSGEDSSQVNAGKVSGFITEFCGKRVEYEELEKKFFLNTPAAFSQYIFEKKQENH